MSRPSGVPVVVGVIDSGWDHTIANERVRPGVGLVSPVDDVSLHWSSDDADRIGHGTRCTSRLLQVAPSAVALPIRVFGASLETSVPVLVAAIDHAAELGLRLINLSLGTRLSEALRPLYAACRRAHDRGVLIVAAVHNVHPWSFPAIFDVAIGVTAGDLPEPLSYQYRPDQAIECVADGQLITPIRMPDGSLMERGSSFAAPVVAGAVARILTDHPAATLDEVRDHLARGGVSEAT